MPRIVVRLLLPAALLPRLALADGSAGVGSGLDRALTLLLLVIVGFIALGVGLFSIVRRGKASQLARPAAPPPHSPPPVRPPVAVATPAPAAPVARPQPGLPPPLPYLLWFFAVVLAGFLVPWLLDGLYRERFGWWAYSFMLHFFYLCVLLVPPHFIALLYYLIRYLNRPYQ